MRLDERTRSNYDLTPAQYHDLLVEARGWLDDIGAPTPPDSLGVLVMLDNNYAGGVSQFVVDISPLWDNPKAP